MGYRYYPRAALRPQASRAFYAAERRNVHVTPKSFLELIKLYTGLLACKRRESQAAMDRLESGLGKLHKTQSEVDVLMQEAKAMALQVEEKVASANVFAEQVCAGVCHQGMCRYVSVHMCWGSLHPGWGWGWGRALRLVQGACRLQGPHSSGHIRLPTALPPAHHPTPCRSAWKIGRAHV